MAKSTCRIHGCHREIKHPQSRLCGTCYAFARYWTDKTVTHRMKRVDQIEFWEKRAKQMLLPTNVKKLRQTKV